MKNVARGMALVLAAVMPLWAAFPGPVEHAPLSVTGARTAVLIDVDADGDGDAIAVDSAGRLLLAIDSDGLGMPSPAAFPAGLPAAAQVAAGDINGDGLADVVACQRSGRRRGGSSCRLLAGQQDTAGFRFVDVTDATGFGPTEPRSLPLLADYDGDGDLDVLVFPERGGKRRGLILRNDLDGTQPAFAIAEVSLPVNRVRGVLVVPDGEGRLRLWVRRSGQPAALLEADAASAQWADRARARGVPGRGSRGGLAVAGDFDGDQLADVLVAGTGRRLRLFRQGADGGFTESAVAAASAAATALAAEDFDRDGRLDVFVGRGRGRSTLLLNRGRRGGDAVDFGDAAAEAGVQGRSRAGVVATFRRPAACDVGIDLLVAPGGRAAGTLHRFPDDSAGRTTAVDSGEATASRRGGCLAAGPGGARLIGHRETSVLRGGTGDDELIARAGVTVLAGGPGRDTFRAAGTTTVISLPPADIVAGELIDCGNADRVWLDTPLTRRELERVGVRFEHCFEDDDCQEAADDAEGACHGIQSPLTLVARNAPLFRLMQFALELDFAAAVPSGFGECTVHADCYALGLDVCQDAYGDFPVPPAKGRCYPTGFDGVGGSLPEWCDDPFWARYRYEQIRQQLAVDDRWLVVPMVVWIVRSDGAPSGLGCEFGGQLSPLSINGWHTSVANAMNEVQALYSKWGVVFDYAYRIVTVPSDSPFVVDSDSDRCRVQLVHDADAGDADENRTIAKLLQAYPSYYRPGQVNVYLSDVAPAGAGAGSGVAWSSPVPFIILRETAGAIRHELGHRLGLGHPYSDNVKAAGVEPDEVESRDSWSKRPFPDPATDRLRVCANDGNCAGVDAGPGDCRKAPGAALGYCRNLKVDCGTDGDAVCDTPWDAFPCFQGVSSNEGSPCTTQADCNSFSSARGTSYLTRCAQGVCLRNTCASSADCGGDSWCADGRCVNHKEGIDACCDLHSDLRANFIHNRCWERQPDGDVVPSPGVGNATVWPRHDNVMTYHSSFGLPRTLTFGQRDRVVCKLGRTAQYDQLPRRLRADGEPCTLRPGGGPSTYGPVGVNATVVHGACASGICAVTSDGNQTTAVCAPSTCGDGRIGLHEASIDCGGVCAPACPTARPDDLIATSSSCLVAADCVSGVCRNERCAPTCSDGQRGATELGADQGGAGHASGCARRATGTTCRFDADCSPTAACRDDGDCVLSADCPINAPAAACTEDDDCGAGDCVIVARRCGLASCVVDSQCPDSFCDDSVNRCACTDASDCPQVGDTCLPSRSFCTKQCSDGRCLGSCELQLGGG